MKVPATTRRLAIPQWPPVHPCQEAKTLKTVCDLAVLVYGALSCEVSITLYRTVRWPKPGPAEHPSSTVDYQRTPFFVSTDDSSTPVRFFSNLGGDPCTPYRAQARFHWQLIRSKKSIKSHALRMCRIHSLSTSGSPSHMARRRYCLSAGGRPRHGWASLGHCLYAHTLRSSPRV